MRNLNKNQKGFSLIELLLIVSIIAFLASVALTSVTKARRTSRDAARLADARNVLYALTSFYNDNGRFPCHEFSNSAEQTFLRPLWQTGNYLSSRPKDPLSGKEPWSFYAYGTLKQSVGGPCGQIAFFEFTNEDPGSCPKLIQSFPYVYPHGGNHCHMFYPNTLPAPCDDPVYVTDPFSCPLGDTGIDDEYP